MRFRPLLLLLLALAPWARAEDGRADINTLQAAVAQGNDWAQTELAMRYELGEGVPKDFFSANRLYCQAARQGNIDAQYKLGIIYAHGRGVTKDEGTAWRLISMAAERGHAHAKNLLDHLPRQDHGQLPECMFPDLPKIAYSLPDPGARRTGSPVNAQQRAEIVQLVRTLAPRYSIDPQLALAVISIESDFNPVAVSPKNAQGLMQLIPETAKRFGVKQVYNPADNIAGGLSYLRWLLAFFQGHVPFVVAAYNAGERAVEKHGGIPPYAETQQYVRKISLMYRKASHPYDRDVVAPSPLMAKFKPARG